MNRGNVLPLTKHCPDSFLYLLFFCAQSDEFPELPACILWESARNRL